MHMNAAQSAREYTHVANFTGYMAVVYACISAQRDPQKILDLPAGNGLLAAKLRQDGHEVVCADINRERPDYVYADMSAPLPFDDGHFDTVVCMEGLEHVLNPSAVVAELCRICKPGGRIIVSLPNVQNIYSRLQFLCTGTFYQFLPLVPTRTDGTGKTIDLGHISPLGYVQLRYLFKYFGAEISRVSGDKAKKGVLLALLWPFILLGYGWARGFRLEDFPAGRIDAKRAHLFNRSLLLSRSLVLEFTREAPAPPDAPT
jgi:SAM-dependent methyltransferase